jgi:molybdopterin/thiamine biosynthesis adenylyltransferase
MSKRWSRQSFLGPTAKSTVTAAKIGIIGLCGGGSHVAQQLAHIGFGTFVLADFDHVEDSNLNRMIGSWPGDAETSTLKTTVIERMVKLIKPAASVVPISGKWQEGELLLRDCTAIFGCVDSFVARDELERFCRRYLIPYIDVGMDVHKVSNGFAISGQVILSLPNQPCMRCLGYLTDERLAAEQQRYGAAGGKPQVVWPNGVLASIAVGQLMSLLLPWQNALMPAVMIEYDGNRQLIKESSKLSILAQRTCPHFPASGPLGDPFFVSL